MEIGEDRLVGIKVARITSWNVQHNDALVSGKSFADIGILQNKAPNPDRNQVICMCAKCVMPSATV